MLFFLFSSYCLRSKHTFYKRFIRCQNIALNESITYIHNQTYNILQKDSIWRCIRIIKHLSLSLTYTQICATISLYSFFYQMCHALLNFDFNVMSSKNVANRDSLQIPLLFVNCYVLLGKIVEFVSPRPYPWFSMPCPFRT